MTNQEILTKAVEKAIKNGYGHYNSKDRDESTQSHNRIVSYNYAGSITVKDFAKSGALIYTEQLSLFDPDFAKALWGESLLKATLWDVQETHELPAWQLHLMLMVIADDPIQYLGEHL
jgi:hypothetical protein